MYDTDVIRSIPGNFIHNMVHVDETKLPEVISSQESDIAASGLIDIC